MKLNDKQKAFCDEYLISFNATESYMKVYGCSYDSAKVNSSRLLTNDNISMYLSSRTEEVKNKNILTLKDIMEFHSKVVNNDYKALGYNKPLYLKDRQVSAEALTKRLELMENKGTDNAIKVKIIKASEALCKK